MDDDERERIQAFRDRMNSVTHPRHPATHKREMGDRQARKKMFFAQLYGLNPDLLNKADVSVQMQDGKPTQFTINGIHGRIQCTPPPMTQATDPEYRTDAQLAMQKKYGRGRNATQIFQDEIMLTPMEGHIMNRKQLAAEAAAMSARLASIQENLGKFEAWPENDDEMPINTIIKFTREVKRKVPADNSTPDQHVHYTGGRAYSSEAIPQPGQRQRLKTETVTLYYAGIKASDEFWYITGKANVAGGLDWDELLDTIVPNIQSFAYQLPLSNEWTYVVGDDLEAMKADDKS